MTRTRMVPSEQSIAGVTGTGLGAQADVLTQAHADTRSGRLRIGVSEQKLSTCTLPRILGNSVSAGKTVAVKTAIKRTQFST